MDDIQKINSESRVAGRRRGHSGYIVRCWDTVIPKSPSTDSTTSLVQLRDKLTALPPLTFNKVPVKISITPELPLVREVSEYDCLNDTKPKRCGVARYSQSDSEKTPLAKKIPVKISITPELPLVREVSECDYLSDTSKPKRCGVARYSQSDTEKTPLAKRRFGVCQSDSKGRNFLAEKRFEALQNRTDVEVKKTKCVSAVHEENKIVATLGTVEESVINDTFDKDNNDYDLLELLVEEALQNKQEKDSGVSTNKTQDSDIIESTPFVNYGRHKKLLTKKAEKTIVSNSVSDESNTDVIDDTPCYVFDRRKKVKTTKASTVGEEIETYNADIVEKFFSQHMAGNNAKGVNPILNNEIVSGASENDNADNFNFHKECINKNIVTDQEIIDCLNSIVDKVCSDLNKSIDLMEEVHRHFDTLDNVQPLDELSNVISDITKIKNKLSLIDDPKKVADKTSKVTLKLKLSKMSTVQKKSKNAKKANKIEKDNEFIENVNTNSPVNTAKASSTRNKRKLYSPKDDINENNEIPRVKVETTKSNVNQTPVAACYKELEKARRSQIRLPRKSRPSTEPLTSPRTRKLNDLFDKIKENVENDENITLVNKTRNKKDFSVYNLSSDSNDDFFKETKIRVQKRVSSSSLESSANKRGRLKPVNSQFDCLSCSSEDEGKKAKKRKIIKKSKPRHRKVKKERKINLTDERMREARPDVLDTSFVKETVIAKKSEEPEPALRGTPVMEIIHDNINDEEAIVPESKTRASNRFETVKINKEISKKNDKAAISLVPKNIKSPIKKEINKKTSNEPDRASVSPLPGLVVETEQTRQDDLTSSVEANLLQKFKKIYTLAHDLNETGGNQNLLTSVDYTYPADVDPSENIETVEMSNSSLEKSIATGGHSPITGHNDFDEAPPNMESLYEHFEHRDVGIEEMSLEMVEFLAKMRNQLNCNKAGSPPRNASPILPMSRMSTRGSTKKQSTTSPKSSNNIPNVVLKRLSSEEIETHLDQPKSSTKIPKVILQRLSSDEIETHVDQVTIPSQASVSSPKVSSRLTSKEIAKSRAHTKTSSTGSPTVVLDRMSSDEMNRWLPIPKMKCDEIHINDNISTEEIPKKYNTRRLMKKCTAVTKTTPDKIIKHKIKSVISPVKLVFDTTDLTKRDSSVLIKYNTRYSTKSAESQITNVNKDDTIICVSQQTSNKESVKKPKNESTNKTSQDKVQGLNNTSKMEKKQASETNDKIENSPESRKIVQEWLKSNATASSTDRADNTALKDLLAKVMETIETTLAEFHQSTGEKLTYMFLEKEKEMKSFTEHSYRVLEEMKRNSMERASEILHDYAERKALMIQLLKEEIQGVVDVINRPDKHAK